MQATWAWLTPALLAGGMATIRVTVELCASVLGMARCTGYIAFAVYRYIAYRIPITEAKKCGKIGY